MYYTHHFAHHATLRRACEWLGRLGLHVESDRDHPEAAPRLSLVVDRGQLAEVELLINALEGADPEGWPSFWDEARLPHSAPMPSSRPAAALTPGRPDPIGWHPVDSGPRTGPDLDRLREAMGR